ncbi:hypothetical protein V1503_18995 [Bacillus sp. SCS-151]|uniref:hypothetical protein n=1 Tax=Nanhaiella sioensis TaxID=3115293 RepID=UPI00397CB953
MSFLSLTINSVKAETFWERGKVENSSKLLNNSWGDFLSQWKEIGDFLSKAIKWVNELPENISTYSINILAKTYELLTTFVLQTPLFLFNNSYVKNATFEFSVIAIVLVIILTMLEGIKRMVKKKHMDLKQISKRFSISLIAAGSAPFLFEQSFALINLITKTISKVGSHQISDFRMFQSVLDGLKAEDIFILIAFDVVVLALLIPVLLQNGRRWWDILTLLLVSPLSLTAWVFNDYKEHFNRWWYNLKKLSQVQLIYAFYICVMTVFILGASFITSGGGLLMKLLIITGGLWRMLNPPHFVKARVNDGQDIEDMGTDMIKTIKGVADTITLKNLRSAKFIRNKSATRKQSIKQLRVKHGQRYVKGLK